LSQDFYNFMDFLMSKKIKGLGYSL